MSIANKDINIDRGKTVIDSRNHYSWSKDIEKPKITMAKYPNKNNGQRCDLEKNSHAFDNSIVQKCDFADNRQSGTSNHSDKSKGQVNYTTSVKNRFWPLCTQEDVNHSSHGHDHEVGADDSDTVGDNKVSKPINTDKCHPAILKDRNKVQNKIEKDFTILAPNNELTHVMSQTDQVNDSISDPDKYALDLRFCLRHRPRSQTLSCFQSLG